MLQLERGALSLRIVGGSFYFFPAKSHFFNSKWAEKVELWLVTQRCAYETAPLSSVEATLSDCPTVSGAVWSVSFLHVGGEKSYYSGWIENMKTLPFLSVRSKLSSKIYLTYIGQLAIFSLKCHKLINVMFKALTVWTEQNLSTNILSADISRDWARYNYHNKINWMLLFLVNLFIAHSLKKQGFMSPALIIMLVFFQRHRRYLI